MAGLWAWIGWHQTATKWLSGGSAILLLIVGVGLGITRESTPTPTLAEGSLQAQPIAARVPATRHSVVGVIRAVGPNELLVRSQRGMFFAVKWGPGSHFRGGGQEIKPAALRPGDAVVIIGQPAQDGSLAASYVTVVPRPAAAPQGENSSPRPTQ
jgi:hypothetical protein